MLRYGLDIGTNSIGWCVLEIDPNGDTKEITATGVRIFPNGRDPQSKASLAVDRRLARSARRRRDRYLLRRADLMTALICHGLMPQDVSARKALELLDPYEVRARALDNAVPLHHLGRALFHLHQRRGFKSNRKAEGSNDDDPGKIKAAGDRLAAILNDEGYRTLGEFLAARHVGKNSNDRERQSVRARLRGEGAKAEYDFYPQRWMVLAELEALWAAQAPHHPHVLTDAALTDIREIMMRQRPLRPVDPGKCALDPAKDKQDVGGRRAPWALPSAQRFRIYQELANLTYSGLGAPAQRLDRAQRDALARLLFKTDKLTFKRIRRTLGLPDETLFNLESDRRDHLLGDRTAHRIGGKKVLGEQWHALDIATQDRIVELLLAADSDSEVVKRLCHDHGLSEVAAQGVAGVTLPDGHCRLGRRAIGKLLPLLRDGVEDVAHPETGEVRTVVIHYDEAARRAGYHHSDRRATTRLARLPYYGEALADHVSGSGDPDDPPEARFGRIPNPTVHIGLNQLRRVINALIATYGAPDQIVVELARELKLGQEEKRRIEREQTENQKKNDARRARLAELGQPDSGENRLRLRLYEEMDAIDRRCVYTGEQICIQMLFGSEVNIDHILPFSRTLDDGFANKVLCLRRANRLKTNKTPFEAFGGQMDWQDILRRAEALPKNKNWRFAPDAMERFERDRDFLDRQLTDTAYLARIAKAYLGHVCNPD